MEKPKVTLADNIYWVGVIDYNLRDFHGFTTKRGTTYNAFLICDEKTALIDTVKHTFGEELLSKVTEIVDPEKIDYIVVNHVEMDHSSSLPMVAKICKNATIITSERGKDAIIEHYGPDFKIQTVKTGDTLKLGAHTLSFIDATMLHWPDSMFTYVVENKILMPSDAFGQHLATGQRFDDEVDEHIIMEEAKIYYANILMLLGPQITRKIQEVVQLGIPIDTIAPSHGIIWRKNPSKIIQAYSEWAAGTTKKKATIVFDTMWGSTEKMARSIAEGVISEGVEVKMFKIHSSDNTEAVTEILDSKAVIIGSPTINNGMFPTLGAFMTYITGLRPKNKIWSFFGSFGWGSGAVRNMTEMARKAGFQIREPGLEIKYVPDKDDLQKCYELGKNIAKEVKA
ncbi:MAG: FprA family A-type flavoprotein [Crenarchaeota archaeon]|nr:FprA family A-type flavoprotein [Thermoproteota archaeon]